ncbi:FUN14 family-domain-containing protein [Schizophyllum amplum]|uniref:FUN14 family-domain-containing protein n=1 Tax=Schizophyllum amplum TaxID=97359 RepID=A0A550CAU1_9AGAR|nr:FUN14 family-domain-containing protein [Auriculariopsis ampla]
MFSSSLFARHVCGASPQIFPRALPSSASHTFVFTGQRQGVRLASALAQKPATVQATASFRPARLFSSAAGVVAAGLGLFAFSQPIVCEGGSPRSVSPTPPPPAPAAAGDRKGTPPPPSSSVSLYELSFGTVAGICAGVFVKKGAKAVAFALGGVFVLLQYLGQVSVLKVDWTAMSRRFENLFYKTDANGVKRAPNVGSLWTWVVDFLTADFQPRASFLAGFVLGIRVG